MIARLKNWLDKRISGAEPLSERKMLQTGSHMATKNRHTPKPASTPNPARGPVTIQSAGTVESLRPGVNVLVREQSEIEDTGAKLSLAINDDEFDDSGHEDGIDPYNTGSFDRSKNWSHRFRK